MAISLKRYEPQVRVSAETGTQKISGAVASQMIAAAGSGFETLAKAADVIGTTSGKIQERNELIKKEAEELQRKNEVEEFNVDYNNKKLALTESLKDVYNQEEADALINAFTTDVNAFVKSNTYLPTSMQDINFLRIGEDKKFDVETASAIATNNTLKRINSLELIRAEAETGKRIEAEFNTATDELIGLDKKYTPAWAVEQKAGFTLKRNYNATSLALKTNIPEAEKMFAELNFNPTDSDKLQTSIFIANQRADEQAEQQQGSNLDIYEKQLKAGDLFPTELKGLDQDVFYINGKQYPIINEEELRLLTMSVDAQASTELQDLNKNAMFNTVLQRFNDYALKGKKYKDKELNALISIAKDSGFSPLVYNDLLKQISINKKTKMTPEQTETFVEINNAFEAFAIEYSGELAINQHLNLIRSFDQKVLESNMPIADFIETKEYKDMLLIKSTMDAESRINNIDDVDAFLEEQGIK